MRALNAPTPRAKGVAHRRRFDRVHRASARHPRAAANEESAIAYLRRQIPAVHFPAFRRSLPSMAGKTVAITGTTSGTGQVAAHTLAGLGATVLLLNRPSPRADAALREVLAAHPLARAVGVACDLQSFDSVRRAAARVRELCPDGLDALCNNAGVMALRDQATPDGFDVQMQTNHLSHFLLTAEVFERLERAASARGEARIVNHSSIARMSPSRRLRPEYLEKRGGRLGGDGRGLFVNGARWLRYNQSKLANAAFTAALHERLARRGSAVKALVAHPGVADTELQVTSVREGGMVASVTAPFMRLAQSMEDGAIGILGCLCLPGMPSGTFYGPGSSFLAFRGPARPFALESFYDNPATREVLWSKSCEAVGRGFLD